MLTDTELRSLADRIGREIPEAHRGAVPLPRTGTALVYFNDGYSGSAIGDVEEATARRLLEQDGFTCGPTALCGERHCRVFEVRPPEGGGNLDVTAAAEEAAWQGWVASRSADPDSPPEDVLELAAHQRPIAEDACDRFDADAVPAG